MIRSDKSGSNHEARPLLAILSAMKNLLFLAVALLFLAAAGYFLLQTRTSSPVPNPSALPTSSPASSPDIDSPNPEPYKDLILLEFPQEGEAVSSPLTVRGQARGPWYFEGSFPVVLTDWNGLIITEGIATAQGEWMTEEYVPFEAELTFEADTRVSDRGSLILQKSNASGLPEHDDAYEITVRLQ